MHINDRSQAGHWKADLAFQQGNQSQNITVLVERKARTVKLIKNNSQHSAALIDKIKHTLLVAKAAFQNFE